MKRTKKMKRRKKMKREATLPLPPLPDELIEKILLRLPVRSLLSLKRVCKSWFSLISDPQFAKSHFDLAAAPTDLLLLKLSEDSDSEVQFVDTEGDYAKVAFKIQRYGHRAEVVGSCRGFLLLTTVTASSDIEFVVWNPSTGIKKLFNGVSRKRPHLCGIGYDSSTDDYVVVTVTFLQRRRGTQVLSFSLKSNTWSSTKDSVPYKKFIHSGDDFGHGLFLNGAIHWLVHSCHGKYHKTIVAFDVEERRFFEIPVPRELKKSISHLKVMGECLCLCVNLVGQNEPTEVWTMKEYKVQSSWTESFVFAPGCPILRRFQPICFTRNGEVLGHDHTKKKQLVRLNDKAELPYNRALETFMFNRRYLLYTGVHRESLLSYHSEKLTMRR